jgi:hypothetical protein
LKAISRCHSSKVSSSTQIEGDQPLPFLESQLVDIGAGVRDDRAAADGIDQDVDGAELLLDRGDGRFHLLRI